MHTHIACVRFIRKCNFRISKIPCTVLHCSAKFSMEVFNNEVVVPSSLAAISPILSVANEIEGESPRVAFLCRFYAFEKAHKLDQSSNAMLFKKLLLQRLERENETSLASRVKETDVREIQAYYQQYYEQYIRPHDHATDRARLNKAYQTAGVIFEVLCSFKNADFYMEVFNNEVLLSSMATISPILSVANEIESESPRVAYLCRFYAFEKAHSWLDRSSSSRSVKQFKTLLLQRLVRENATSLASRVKKTDLREIQAYYQQYHEQYIRPQDHATTSDQLSKAYQTAGVIFEVLCAVNKTSFFGDKCR